MRLPMDATCVFRLSEATILDNVPFMTEGELSRSQSRHSDL